MKKNIVFSSLFFVLCLLSPRYSFAQNIQTGNSSATSTVETNIQGNGNVKTHIETSANGVTKTLDATGSGIYKVEVRSNGNNAPQNSNNPVFSPSSFRAPTASATPTVKPDIKNKIQEKSFAANISKFVEIISSFFKRILSNL